VNPTALSCGAPSKMSARFARHLRLAIPLLDNNRKRRHPPRENFVGSALASAERLPLNVTAAVIAGSSLQWVIEAESCPVGGDAVGRGPAARTSPVACLAPRALPSRPLALRVTIEAREATTPGVSLFVDAA